MKPSSKRQLAKEEMRQRILDVSEAMFLQESYEQTTMRKIALDLKCNPATLYNYFENKEAIFFELQERAFLKFYEEFDDLRNSEIRGFKKLKKMGRKYVSFGIKHPNYYELMFVLKPPMAVAVEKDPHWKIGGKNYDLLKEVIAECIEEGSVDIQNVESGAFMVWAMVHGMVSLSIMDRCKMMLEEDLDFLAKEAHLGFERILKSKR